MTGTEIITLVSTVLFFTSFFLKYYLEYRERVNFRIRTGELESTEKDAI